MNLINISDNELNKINGGVAWIPILIKGAKIAVATISAVGITAEGINYVGSAYESAKNGYDSFRP